MKTWQRESMGILVGVMLCASAGAQSARDAHTPHTHRTESDSSVLKQSGQATFAALSEAVGVLEADPNTDWSKANVTRLRDHLLDMDEVIMRSEAQLLETADGVRITVTGAGRTLSAIRRMVPAHAAMMDGHRDWRSSTQSRDDGIVWSIATPSPNERMRIRALGLYGLLTLGSHHMPHHLALAKGEALPGH